MSGSEFGGEPAIRELGCRTKLKTELSDLINILGMLGMLGMASRQDSRTFDFGGLISRVSDIVIVASPPRLLHSILEAFSPNPGKQMLRMKMKVTKYEDNEG